jgi:hypothetical protein
MGGLLRVAGRTVLIGAAPLLFAVGGSAGVRAPAAPRVSVEPARAPSAVSACVDADAMAANESLVGQIREANARLRSAEERGRELTAALAARARAAPQAIEPAREEWSSMARARTLRVRTPCARLGAAPGFWVTTPYGGRGHGSSHRGGSLPGRAEAARLSEEELEALASSYGRAHERTWATMKGACAAAGVRLPDDENEREAEDHERIRACKARLIQPAVEEVRVAAVRVAELRAAGATVARTRSERERVLFALTESASVLFEEMTRSLGREKAARAVDYGVLCLDETIYVLSETSPSG